MTAKQITDCLENHGIEWKMKGFTILAKDIYVKDCEEHFVWVECPTDYRSILKWLGY